MEILLRNCLYIFRGDLGDIIGIGFKEVGGKTTIVKHHLLEGDL